MAIVSLALNALWIFVVRCFFLCTMYASLEMGVKCSRSKEFATQMADDSLFVVVNLHVTLEIVVVVEFLFAYRALILSGLVDVLHMLAQIFELKIKFSVRPYSRDKNVPLTSL